MIQYYTNPIVLTSIGSDMADITDTHSRYIGVVIEKTIGWYSYQDFKLLIKA